MKSQKGNTAIVIVIILFIIALAVTYFKKPKTPTLPLSADSTTFKLSPTLTPTLPLSYGIIFIKEQTPEKEIQTLISEIKKIDGVTNVKYTSTQDAYEQFKKNMRNSPNLTDLASPDNLPASIEVKINDSRAKEKVSTIAKSKPFVTEVNGLK